MEAVKWLQEKLDGEPSRKDIVRTMQVRGRIAISTDYFIVLLEND